MKKAKCKTDKCILKLLKKAKHHYKKGALTTAIYFLQKAEDRITPEALTQLHTQSTL
jgi:hypothetical protein